MTTRPDIERFRKIDDRLSAVIIASDYLIVIAIALIALYVQNWFATLAAIVLIAGRQVALLNIVHAAAHYSLFAKRKANDSVDWLIAYPILDAVAPYREYHMEHHREIALRTPDRFEYLLDQLPESGASFWRRTWVVVIQPLIGAAGIDFVRSTIDQCQDDPIMRRKLIAYWVAIIGLFTWIGWLPHLLVYWILPLVWLYPVFYFWAEVSDHYAVKDEARNQRGLFYSIFIKGHEMYHAVHHMYPGIPFYRVKAANLYLKSIGHEIEESRGIVDFVRILYQPAPMESPPAPVHASTALADPRQ